jgi:hypothetical protein
MNGMRTWGVVIGVVALLAGGHARADTTGELYSELRDVIDDVIRGEVAKDIAGDIRVEHPSLCFYFRGALGRMQSSYWGGVPSQLRDGVGVLASDFAFWYLHQEKRTSDAACPSVSEPTAYDAFRQFICVRDRELRGHGGATPACTPEGWSNQTSLLEGSCKLDKVKDEDQLPCALAQAGLLTLRGEHHEASDVIKDYVITSLGGDEQLFRLVVNGTKDANALYRDVVSRLGNGPLAAIEKESPCKLSFELSGSSPCWYLDFGDKVDAAKLQITFFDKSRAVVSTNLIPATDLIALLHDPKHYLGGPADGSLAAGGSGSAAASGDDSGSIWSALVPALGKVEGCPKAIIAEIKLDDVATTIALKDGGICASKLSDATTVESVAQMFREWSYWKPRFDEFVRTLHDFGIDPTAPTVAGLNAALARVRKLATASDIVRAILPMAIAKTSRSPWMDSCALQA